MTHDEIMRELSDERGRQRAQWVTEHAWGYGDCSSPIGALGPWSEAPLPSGAVAPQYSNLIKAAVLAEEAAEAVQAALDVNAAQFKVEVVQALAVAYAILEGLPS